MMTSSGITPCIKCMMVHGEPRYKNCTVVTGRGEVAASHAWAHKPSDIDSSREGIINLSACLSILEELRREAPDVRKKLEKHLNPVLYPEYKIGDLSSTSESDSDTDSDSPTSAYSNGRRAHERVVESIKGHDKTGA